MQWSQYRGYEGQWVVLLIHAWARIASSPLSLMGQFLAFSPICSQQLFLFMFTEVIRQPLLSMTARDVFTNNLSLPGTAQLQQQVGE